jgi:hypothetical protein
MKKIATDLDGGGPGPGRRGRCVPIAPVTGLQLRRPDAERYRKES